MLHLDPGVHLHEVEAAVGVEQELDGARADVADVGGQRHRGLAHPRAQLGVERRTRALLDQLLVPPLHRAVPLAQVDHPAVAVAHHLDLDVARVLQVLLDVDRAVAERRQRLVLGQAEELGELLGVLRDAHALPAAAGRGLDDDRKADLLGEGQRLVRVLDACRASPARWARRPPAASRRAVALSPIWRIWSPVGPMNVMLEARQVSANSAFSARKP